MDSNVYKPLKAQKAKGENARKKRKMIRTTIQLKKEIIEKFESGFRVKELSSEYNIPRSTISTIMKNREIIKAADVAKGVKVVTKQRPQALEEVEKLLLIWVNKKQLDGETISEPIVCEKAKQLFEDLSKKRTTVIGEEQKFKASRGWYENFKKRSGISRHEEASTARKISAERFINDFNSYITSEGLVPQQVFTCNETGLFWKKLLEKTFQEEMDEGEERDKVTLLLCSNASGDLKLKPLLVYNGEISNDVTEKDLPVLWRTHPKGWITKQLFMEWMNEVFGPTVKKYLLGNNLSLKALFVLDNAPTHPVDLEDSLDDEFNFITVRFLPSDATPLLRPLDLDVISNFKKLYLKLLLQRCFIVTSNSDINLRDFWTSHVNIEYTVQLINTAWCEVSQIRINSSWRKLWPKCISETDLETLETESAATMEEILNLSQVMDLKMNSLDVDELLLDFTSELTTEELLELQKEHERLMTVEISAGVETKEEIPICLIKDACAKWADLEGFVRKHHPDKGLVGEVLDAMNEHVFSYFVKIINAKKNK